MPTVIKPSKFTFEEELAIKRAARQTWGEIAYDVLGDPADGKCKSIPRAHVIELVTDANRLTGTLKRSGHKELAERLDRYETADYKAIDKLLKTVFSGREG